MPASRGLTVFDKALYTSSTLALRPDDGTLAWFAQHIPAESLDLDEVFERVLVDIGNQKVVFSAGKSAILWKHERRTGQFLGATPMVYQNVYDSIDPKTGETVSLTLGDLKNDLVVVIFLANHCPVVQNSDDRIIELTKKYEAKGVKFVAICCTSDTGGAASADNLDAILTPATSFDHTLVTSTYTRYTGTPSIWSRRGSVGSMLVVNTANCASPRSVSITLLHWSPPPLSSGA